MEEEEEENEEVEDNMAKEKINSWKITSIETKNILVSRLRSW